MEGRHCVRHLLKVLLLAGIIVCLEGKKRKGQSAGDEVIVECVRRSLCECGKDSQNAKDLETCYEFLLNKTKLAVLERASKYDVCDELDPENGDFQYLETTYCGAEKDKADQCLTRAFEAYRNYTIEIAANDDDGEETDRIYRANICLARNCPSNSPCSEAKGG